MTFLATYRFELLQQSRRLWPWVAAAAMLLIVVLLTRDGALAEALYDDFFVNSPFSIAKTTVVGSLFWLLAFAGIAGEAGSRDLATGIHPLLYAAPVSKRDYLGGRFLAAFTLNALVLFGVQLGVLLGVYLPGLDPAVIGPFRPEAHLGAFAIISLPTALVATALQFSLALRSGRATSAYLASIGLLFTGFFLSGFLTLHWGVGKILDPIGVHFILSDLSHDWTSVEKSWRLLALEGTVLRNRAFWTAAGLLTLALMFWRFEFAHRAEAKGWRPWRRRAVASPISSGVAYGQPTAAKVRVPAVTREFGFAIHLRQMLATAVASYRMLATSWAGRGLLVAVPLLTIVVVIDGMTSLGIPLVPTTALVLGELTAPFSAQLSRWVFAPVLTVFFAGELVWRERDAGLGEIVDAMPGSAWAPLLGKLLGLSAVLATFAAMQIGAGVAAQAILGHREFELGLYVTALLGLQLPEYLLFAALALVVHVVVDQKYLGHLVALCVYVFVALASLFRVEHDLLIYGAGPWWSYTEMRGFGASLAPWMWFRLYWAGWATLLLVLAALLWGRGRSRGLGERLRLARGGVSRATATVAGVAALATLGVGSFVFYNTNILNAYRNSKDAVRTQAEYERRYAAFARAAQPEVVRATMRIEIHPRLGSAELVGSHQLVNTTAVAIDTLHLAPALGVTTGPFELDRAATLLVDDSLHAHRIYALAEPLQPGDSIRVGFTVRAERRGFRESGASNHIVPNGSQFTSAWLPALGYQRGRELTSFGARRKAGLPAKPVIPSLYDVSERVPRARGRIVDVVVGTDAGQVAVAPGALRRRWDEDGRAYFHYVTDAPVGDEYAFFSAVYDLREDRWEDPTQPGRAVDIRIYHHPTHGGQVDRMLRSIRASLDHYTREIGPYRFGHLTFVEHAGNGTGMHADASEVSFSEGSALLTPRDDSTRLDLPFGIVAHEMAHQWAVPSAYVEGAPVMSESLAWFYAMQVLERSYGEGGRRRLLAFMRQPYPYAPIRRGEPLLRGLDPYMSYRKGPFALHALSEYVGDAPINLALRRVFEAQQVPGAALATTLDLYREIQRVTPDSLQYLAHDLFEVNTFWEFEARRVSAVALPSGEWRVTMALRARKTVADSAGVETELPMDEWVELAVFAPVDGSDKLADPLYRQRHRIRSGVQNVTVVVARKPALAGIDPFHVLDVEEKEVDNNLKAVRINN